MNLILAVIIFAFIKTQKRELEDEIIALHGEDGKDNPLATSIVSQVDLDQVNQGTEGGETGRLKKGRTKR
jgi:hypothetical protein